MSATAVQTKPPEASSTNIESLFQEHKAMVFRAAYRITGSASEAEDVLQTVFLRLVQHTDNRHEVGQEKLTAAYIHRAAINCALDIVRHRRRTPSVPLEEAAAQILYSQNPQHDQEDRELRLLLQEAVGRLSEKSAEVFVLRYFEGQSNREIADTLGTSPLVVAVMLHRARTRLRAEIGEFLEKKS